MVLIIKNFIQYLREWNWSEKTSPRMQHLLFMDSPWPPILICLTYLLFVLKLGPAWMKNRDPFKLKQIILIYNFIQIVLNFYNGLRALFLGVYYRPYDLGCMLPLNEHEYLGLQEMTINHNYYLLKILDLMDTVFFILRKNYKQVTFLHVYHHSAIVLCTYGVFRIYGGGGHLNALGILNMLVHGVMYTYYLVSALDKRLTWWKKYVTIFQIVQFIVLIFHALWPWVMRPDCVYPKPPLVLLLTQSSLMLVLFTNFYLHAYVGTQNTVKNKNLKTN